MSRTGLALLIVVLAGGGALVTTAGPPTLYIGHFSAASSSQTHPTDWRPIRFGNNDAPTSYDLVQSGSTVVLRARSENGASGLITYQRVDLSTHPVIEWRWRIESTVDGGNVAKKEADDAAARLYVTFDYSGLGWLNQLKLTLLRNLGYGDLPTRAINYVWTNQLPQGDLRPSPYTDQIMMLPVRSGSTRVGEWVRERRNVRADYREAFGEAPPPVAGVALMTDTDHTGDSTQALYGDIVFRPAPGTTNAAPTDLPSGGDS
ncbi:MAG: DUF3047 domain-containing protein [Salinibacter sp.]|uniref:DUF3047 domain-containing protein n=1 Tax=Salinibacter sp. TaxID=2065818 RepID=UPI0035D46173